MNIIEFILIQTNITYLDLLIYIIKYVLLANYLSKGVSLIQKMEVRK